jgi:RNA polymerase sigma factor (sigma-70 family)
MHIRRNQSNRVVADPENDLNGVLAEKLNISERIALQTVLKELDEEERSIILLHAVSGYKHHEIASYLGIPLATALSKYHRGLKKMRRLVAAQEGNGHG